MYGLLINANLVLYLVMQDIRVLGLCLCEILLFAITLLIYQKIYAHASKALVNNMCMLLAISFLILTRLDIDKAIEAVCLCGRSGRDRLFCADSGCQVKGLG